MSADDAPLTLTNSHQNQCGPTRLGAEADGLSDELEVVLDAVDTRERQRRSSTSITSARRPGVPKRGTSCFVHGLFQDHRLRSDEPYIPENGPIISERKNDKDPNGQGANDEELSSRLLTKEQLSDMSFSIRELAKRLGRFRLKLNVHNVFLLTKAHDETLIGLTREMAGWLLSSESGGNYTVYVEDTLKEHPHFDAPGLIKQQSCGNRLKYWDNELCRREPHTFDIVVALGGDGTVLYASWLFQNVAPPVLSFALGSLGFLTKFDFDDFRHILTEVFHSGLTVSIRQRLEATIMRAQKFKPKLPQSHKSRDLVEELIGDGLDDEHTHKPEQTRDILNDLVLDRGPNPTMSSIEVLGDKYHITTVQADGVCVATPTGSTAYNLAAGGSLCHPENPVILVTAICAHTLNFRPIIIPDTVVLRLGVPFDARASSWVSFDGKDRVELTPGDYVTISASRYPFPTVLPLGKGGEDWIDSLSRTLNWNSRQKQKPFTDKK